MLLPLEVEILGACLAAGDHGVHGFAIAKVLADSGDGRRLTATGTLYRALHRLETAGMVEGEWEELDDDARGGRPRRRTYRLTAEGAATLTAARAHTRRAEIARLVQPGWST
jgi:DNA-binding PadR family transcriptional regulator